jgi:hypothetical protein
MDPFSFKADLEAQAVDEWFDLINKHIIRRLLRTLLRWLWYIVQIGIRTTQTAVQASTQRTPNRVDNPARNLMDERHA